MTCSRRSSAWSCWGSYVLYIQYIGLAYRPTSLNSICFEVCIVHYNTTYAAAVYLWGTCPCPAPFEDEEKNFVLILNVKNAKFWTLLKMYTWNVPPGLPSPLQIYKYATGMRSNVVYSLSLGILHVFGHKTSTYTVDLYTVRELCIPVATGLPKV